MKLITKTLAAKIPAMYATEDQSAKEKIVQCKFFDSRGSWTWYVIEYDPEQNLAFGLVQGFETELGYISITELESLGIRIERDLSWKPRSLEQLKQELKRPY